MRAFKAEPGEVSGGEMEVKRQGRAGMGRGREGKAQGCSAVHSKTVSTPHSPKGKEKKTQTEQPTKVNLIAVSRSSNKHSLSTYCVHSGGSTLEPVTERKVEAQEVESLLGSHSDGTRGTSAVGPSLSRAAGTPWPVPRQNSCDYSYESPWQLLLGS